MDDLRKFYDTFGHCNVPRDDPQFPRLYLWIREQRRHLHQIQNGEASNLSKSRLESLQSVGLNVDSLGGNFAIHLEALKEFHRQYGHCNVPPDYSTNQKLFPWIERLRIEYQLKSEGKRNTLRNVHIHSLNKLNFSWISPCTKIGLKRSKEDLNGSDFTLHADQNVVGIDNNTNSVEIVRPIKKPRIHTEV